MNKLIFLVGLPGCGKTTLATIIANTLPAAAIYEGQEAGSIRLIAIAVATALRSPRELSLLLILFAVNSAITAPITAVSIRRIIW